MPMYDYRCSACSQAFELLVRSSTVPACPHCQSTELQRQVSLTAAPGTSQALIAAGRRAAAREGHFSNYSKADRAKIK
ncbi:Putative regulatory protein, FmdB family [Rubrivivax sp. A210]|uniref:FmdB family zinc ribbon protein n=1 Tax=Rubrivivax sp. A210 TaxID=2772301 RepID=UPI0019180491|nr:zinc ribbon domain-containing protein [Rubrivivax sp. A210]CAD5371946.1 Putative regulatory protein, FmdB family [Rubrivivax sp. A210]